MFPIKMKMNGRACPPVEPLCLNYHSADKPLNTQPSPRPGRLRPHTFTVYGPHHQLRSVLFFIYVSLKDKVISQQS